MIGQRHAGQGGEDGQGKGDHEDGVDEDEGDDKGGTTERQERFDRGKGDEKITRKIPTKGW